jgi:putative transposase
MRLKEIAQLRNTAERFVSRVIPDGPVWSHYSGPDLCLHLEKSIKAVEELWPDSDRQRCTVHRLRNVIAKLPKNEQLHNRVRNAYWAALDLAGSAADGEARLRTLVGELQTDYPSAAACLAEDLPALCVHLRYPLRLLERSLGEVKRRTKVIGRFPGETSCLSLCWAVLDLVIAGARGLALTDFEHRQLADMRAAKRAQSSVEMTA